MIKRSNLRVVLELAISLVFCLTVSAQAQDDGAVSAQVVTKKLYETNGLTAIIAAPSEISMAQSRALPVWVQMVSIEGAPLPDEISIQASWGQWVGSKDETLRLKLNGGTGAAVLVLSGLEDPGKEPLSIEAASIKGDGFFGRVETKIHQQNVISIVNAPQNAPADGKTKTTVQARVVDQFGEPMSGVFCFLRYQTTQNVNHQFALSQTNDMGVVSFQIPALSQEGRAICQFDTGKLVSSQFTVNFN